MAYTPRPGSKTEAAIAFLRANGGQATATQLAEGIDTEQKQFTGLFGAAIEHGFLVEITIEGKRGYRLGTAGISVAPSWARPPVFKPGDTEAAGQKQPETKPKTVQQVARSLNIVSIADAKPEALPPPVIVEPAPARPFRVGRFSDGTLRLEGAEADIFMEPFEDTEVTAVTLSRDAAEKLVAYLATR